MMGECVIFDSTGVSSILNIIRSTGSLYMSVGVMKDEKLKLRDLHTSHF